MLPFRGCNLDDYWTHWLTFAESTDAATRPKIFYVNCFCKDGHGEFLWPGVGENSRVLARIFDRSAGRGDAQASAVGYLPTESAIDGSGLVLSEADWNELFHVEAHEWHDELLPIYEHVAEFGDQLQAELVHQLSALATRLRSSN
jgi:phosphoenolpyruvate carboxykinase (GTP)